MKEEWKDIKGYEGVYAVSNQGRVLRRESFTKHPSGSKKIVRERVLKPANSGGYLIVMLANNNRVNKLIHRLVAEAFIPNPQSKPWINHKDGNPSNNSIGNLEWCTPSENELHKIHTLQHVGEITNLKYVEKTGSVLSIGNKTCFGHKTQMVIQRLLSGESIETNSTGVYHLIRWIIKKYDLKISKKVNSNRKGVIFFMSEEDKIKNSHLIQTAWVQINRKNSYKEYFIEQKTK